MAKKIPDSTKNSLHLRLVQRARARWPDLADVRMRYRASFAYVDGILVDGPVIPLCRLRYLGSATTWGFAIYRASHDDYEDNVLPSGSPTGTAEEALDCACGLYLTDPAIWTLDPRRFNGDEHYRDLTVEVTSSAVAPEADWAPPALLAGLPDHSRARPRTVL